MAHTAGLEQSKACFVVWLLVKFQRAAVVHELFEFVGLPSAQVFKGRFNLLFLNIVVLFVLGAPRETLPR